MAGYVFKEIFFPGSAYTQYANITADGQIVGTYVSANNIAQGFLFNNDKYILVEAPVSSVSTPHVSTTVNLVATDINSTGVISGYYQVHSVSYYVDPQHPGITDTTTIQGFTKLSPVYISTPLNYPGAKYTWASDINDLGQVIGNYQDANGITYSFLEENGSYTKINVLGSLNTSAIGINNSGQIIGSFQDDQGIHGFIEKNDIYTTINFYGASSTSLRAFNNNGMIGGSYQTKNNQTFGFIEINGVYTSINFPGSNGTWINSINDLGYVVGGYSDNNGNHAFVEYEGVYTIISSQTNIIPNSLLNFSAGSISNSGQIIVSGQSKNDGLIHYYLATPAIAPSINLISKQTIEKGMPTNINGINIIDPFAGSSSITVDVQTIDASIGLLFQNIPEQLIIKDTTYSNIDVNHITIKGTISNVNAALSHLYVTSDTVGKDVLSISVVDGGNDLIGVGVVNITVANSPKINLGSTQSFTVYAPSKIIGLSIADLSTENNTITADILASNGILTDTANNVTISNNGSKHITISGTLMDVNSALSMLNYTGQIAGSDTLTVTVTDNGTGFSTTNSITQTIMSGVYNYFFAVANPSSFISTSIPTNTVLGTIIPLNTNLNPSFSFSFAQDAQGNGATQSLNSLTINPTTGVVTTAADLNSSTIDEWVTIKDNTGSSYTGKFELIFSGVQSNVIGRTNNDFIIANAATKLITAYEGNDTIVGQAGNSAIAYYRGTKSDYNVTKYSDHVVITDTVANRDGTDTLYNIHQIQFNTGGNLIYDIANNNDNALIYKLYQATFGRCPDNAGLHFWVDQLNGAHKSIEDITNGFISSQEFANRFGSNVTNAQFVDKLYNNILNRGGETAGVIYWNNELDTGHKDKVMALIGFAVSPENALKTSANIDNGFLVS